MLNKLKSALILLNNVYFEHRKFTRETFASKLADEGLSFSQKKITDLLKFIDEIFGVELTFKNKNRMITIKDDCDSRYHFIKSLLFFGKLKKEQIRKENHIISYTSEVAFKNSDLIFDLYEAITRTKEVKITYQKFYTDRPQSYILKPLLLKEYLGRWYLIAEKKKDQIRVFGIERIIDFEVLSKTFQPNLGAIELYQNTIGVNYTEKVETVKLWVEDYQLKLFETTPLHPSQKIIERFADYGILTVEVSVNYELKQLIASFINKVRVLEPESLKQEMKEIFREILKKYETRK